MAAIRETDEFTRWLGRLRDKVAKAKIAIRVQRLAKGNPGDVKPVGEGVSEMRIHHGPGYRVYFIRQGEQLIVLLCGGDKDTQDADIVSAKKIARGLKDENDD